MNTLNANPYNEAKALIINLLEQMDQMKVIKEYPDDEVLATLLEEAQNFVDQSHKLHMVLDDRYCGEHDFYWSDEEAKKSDDYGHEEIHHYVLKMDTLGIHKEPQV